MHSNMMTEDPSSSYPQPALASLSRHSAQSGQPSLIGPSSQSSLAPLIGPSSQCSLTLNLKLSQPVKFPACHCPSTHTAYPRGPDKVSRQEEAKVGHDSSLDTEQEQLTDLASPSGDGVGCSAGSLSPMPRLEREDSNNVTAKNQCDSEEGSPSLPELVPENIPLLHEVEGRCKAFQSQTEQELCESTQWKQNYTQLEFPGFESGSELTYAAEQARNTEPSIPESCVSPELTEVLKRNPVVVLKRLSSRRVLDTQQRSGRVQRTTDPSIVIPSEHYESAGQNGVKENQKAEDFFTRKPEKTSPLSDMLEMSRNTCAFSGYKSDLHHRHTADIVAKETSFCHSDSVVGTDLDANRPNQSGGLVDSPFVLDVPCRVFPNGPNAECVTFQEKHAEKFPGGTSLALTKRKRVLRTDAIQKLCKHLKNTVSPSTATLRTYPGISAHTVNLSHRALLTDPAANDPKVPLPVAPSDANNSANSQSNNQTPSGEPLSGEPWEDGWESRPQAIFEYNQDSHQASLENVDQLQLTSPFPDCSEKGSLLVPGPETVLSQASTRNVHAASVVQGCAASDLDNKCDLENPPDYLTAGASLHSTQPLPAANTILSEQPSISSPEHNPHPALTASSEHVTADSIHAAVPGGGTEHEAKQGTWNDLGREYVHDVNTSQDARAHATTVTGTSQVSEKAQTVTQQRPSLLSVSTAGCDNSGQRSILLKITKDTKKSSKSSCVYKVTQGVETDAPSSEALLSGNALYSMQAEAVLKQSQCVSVVEKVEERDQKDSCSVVQEAYHMVSSQCSTGGQNSFRNTTARSDSTGLCTQLEIDIPSTEIAVMPVATDGGCATVDATCAITCVEKTSPSFVLPHREEKVEVETDLEVMQNHYYSTVSAHRQHETEGEAVVSGYRQPPVTACPEELLPLDMLSVMQTWTDDRVAIQHSYPRPSDSLSHQSHMIPAGIIFVSPVTTQRQVIVPRPSPARRHGFFRSVSDSNDQDFRHAEYKDIDIAALDLFENGIPSIRYEPETEEIEADEDNLVVDEELHDTDEIFETEQASDCPIMPAETVIDCGYLSEAEKIAEDLVLTEMGSVVEPSTEVLANSVCMETALPNSHDVDEASSAVQVVECEVLVDETEELADADANDFEGYDSDATLPYPRNDDHVADHNSVPTNGENNSRVGAQCRSAARVPAARRSSLERVAPHRDRKNYPKRSRQTLPISLAELPATDRHRKKRQKATKPRGTGASRHPLFKKRNKDVVERKKRQNEEPVKTGTNRALVVSRRGPRAGEKDSAKLITDRKKHDKKDMTGSSAAPKSSRAYNPIRERRTQKKETNTQHKPSLAPIEQTSERSEEPREPLSEQGYPVNTAQLFGEEGCRTPKERQKGPRGLGARGRRRHRGRGRRAANGRLRAAPPVTFEPSHQLSEESESDELPTILPPKRRRNQGNKTNSWRSAEKVRQMMQDPLVDPHGSSAERIMREFPRHNWLEHKILHRSATYALPNTGSGGSVSGGAEVAPRRSSSSPGGGGVPGPRVPHDNRVAAIVAGCGERVAAAKGVDGGDADIRLDVATCQSDEKSPAQQEAVVHGVHASSTIPDERQHAKPGLTQLATPPTPAPESWDLKEGTAMPLTDTNEDSKGLHGLPEHVANHSKTAGLAGTNPGYLPCQDLHESGGSQDSQGGAAVLQTRLYGAPSVMARSKSSDALLRCQGEDNSAVKQVKRRRRSDADVRNAEAVDVKDLTRDLEDWKKIKNEAPTCSSVSLEDGTRTGNEALACSSVPLTATCRTRESLGVSGASDVAVLTIKSADPSGRPEGDHMTAFQRSHPVESRSLGSTMDLVRGRSPQDRPSVQGSFAEDSACKKEIPESGVPRSECSRPQPAASDNTLPLDLCVKKSEMLGSNSRPRGNLPVQLVLPQVQSKATPLVSAMTSAHDPEAPGGIIGSTKQTLKVMSESIAGVAPEVLVAGGEVAHLLPYGSSRQPAATNAVAPGFSSTSGIAFSAELAGLPRGAGECAAQGDSAVETVPGLGPRAGEGGLEPWHLLEERDLGGVVRASGSAINRDYVRQSLSLAASANTNTSNSSNSSNSSVGTNTGRHNSESVTFAVDPTDVEPYSSKVELAFPVNLTCVSMDSIECGPGVHAVPLEHQGTPGGLCSSESDLDLEFKKTLREFKELEMLAARKEQEREQVLAMRKRKAEMLVQMEIKRRRLAADVDGLPSSSAGTASSAACPDGPSLALDGRLIPEEASGVLDGGMLSADFVTQVLNKAGPHGSMQLGLTLGPGRLAQAGLDLQTAGPQLNRESGHRPDSFSSQVNDKEPLREQEKRSVVEMINQAVACRRLRPHDGPHQLASTGIRSAHDASKSSNPFISVDAKPVASSTTSPYARRDTPLEEPPIPRARQRLVGSPKQAHSQQPFQPAGSLIVLAPQADSQLAAEMTKPVLPARTPSPSRAHAATTCSASETHRPPSHELHRRLSGPDPTTNDQGHPLFPDSRPEFRPAKTSRHHRPAPCVGEASLEMPVIDLTREPNTPGVHSQAEGAWQPDSKVVTVDLDVESVIQSELSAAVAKKGNGGCPGLGPTSVFSEGLVPQMSNSRLAPRPGQHVVHDPQAPDVHGLEVGFSRYPTSSTGRRKGPRHQSVQDVPSPDQPLHVKQRVVSPVSSQPQQELPGLRTEGEPLNLLGRMPLPSGTRHAPHSNTVGYVDLPHVGVHHVRSGVSRFPLTGVPNRHPMYIGHEKLTARDGSHLMHSQQVTTSVHMGHSAPGLQHLAHTSMAHKHDSHSSFPIRPTVPGQFLPPAKVEDGHTLVLRNPMEETSASRISLPHGVVPNPEVNSGVLVLMHNRHHQQHQQQRQQQQHQQHQKEIRTEGMALRPVASPVQMNPHHGHLTTVHQTQRPTHAPQQQHHHQVLQQPTHLHPRGPELPHHVPATHLPSVPATTMGGAYSLPPALPASSRVPVVHHSLSSPGPPRPLLPAAGPPVAPMYRPPARLPSAEYLSPRPEVPVLLGQAMGSGILQPALPPNRMPDVEHSLRQAQPPPSQAVDTGPARGPFHSPVQPYPFPPQMSSLHGQPRLPIATQPQHPRHGFLQHHQPHLQHQHQQSLAAGRAGPSDRVADYQQRSPQHLPHATAQQAAAPAQQHQQQKHAAQMQQHQQQEQQRQPQLPTHALKPEGSCGLCGKPAMYLCSNCRLVWYCSHECQTAHWATHAGRCKPNT